MLDKHTNKQSSRAVNLLFWTAARRTEVLGAKWGEFDLDRIDEGKPAPIWVKPAERLKQRRESTISLNEWAVVLLREMRKEAEAKERGGKDNYLFPSGGSHLQDINNFWAGVRTKIKRPDLHLHDLRHEFASTAIDKNVPLETMTAMLGHKRSRITERYAHQRDERMREASNRAMAALAPSSVPKALPAF